MELQVNHIKIYHWINIVVNQARLMKDNKINDVGQVICINHYPFQQNV